MIEFRDLTLATTVHNNADMSAAMLASFEKHLGTPEEIVLVDDGSQTPAAVSGLRAPLRTIRNEEPLGFCKASDRALREVRTPFALLVDADILFESGDFAGGYAEFQKGNWAWTNFRQTNFAGVPQDAYENPLMPPWVFASGNQVMHWWEKSHRAPLMPANARFREVEVAHSSCALVRMEAFRAVNGFDRWYWQCQSDTDLSLRLRTRGFHVGIDTGYVVKHEGAGGKEGGTARVLDLYRARVHLYEKFHPASRLYLRPLLFVRHTLELIWFAMHALFKNEPRLKLRRTLWKGALKGYR